jgi:hypothetical protein
MYWESNLCVDGNYDSPAQKPRERCDYPLHDATVRCLLNTSGLTVGSIYSGEIWLPAPKCINKIWLPNAFLQQQDAIPRCVYCAAGSFPEVKILSINQSEKN